MTECGCYNYDEYLGRTESEGYFHSEDCKYPKLIEELNNLVHEVEHAAWDVGGNYVAKRLREILK